MTSELSGLIEKALPALSGDTLRYNSENGAYQTSGYISARGNNYYRTIRCDDRLLIYYDIGCTPDGCRFLNGITLYTWCGQNAVIIAQKSWGGHLNYKFFNEYTAKQESIYMLRDYLVSQAKIMGSPVSERQILEYANNMIGNAYRKHVA